jgi:voltage-gated potassium channel
MKQPDRFENIGQSLWWSVATLTTVGYGDIYPITGLGKVLSSVALIRLDLLLATGIISSAFISKDTREKRKWKKCRNAHCGTKF